MKKTIQLNDKTFLCKPIKDGEGSYAKCYITEGNKTLKVYYSSTDERQAYTDIDLLPLLGIKNDTFIFPEQLFINDDGIVQGYITKYIPGRTLSQLGDNASFIDMILSVDKVYKDIEEISKMGIYSSDVSPNNIILNERFYIIDTDNYSKLTYMGYKECLRNNNFNFNDSIVDFIKRYTIGAKMILLNSVIEDIEYDLLNEDNPKPILSEYLNEIKSLAEFYSEDKTETVGNIKRALIRTRK